MVEGLACFKFDIKAHIQLEKVRDLAEGPGLLLFEGIKAEIVCF